MVHTVIYHDAHEFSQSWAHGEAAKRSDLRKTTAAMFTSNSKESSRPAATLLHTLLHTVCSKRRAEVRVDRPSFLDDSGFGLILTMKA